MTDKTKQPGIKIQSIIMLSSQFQREVQVPNEINGSFDFKYEPTINNGKGIAKLTCEAKGLDKDGRMQYSVVCAYVGIFEVDAENANMPLDEFLKHNAHAVLIPYMREHVSELCVKGRVPIILIPPVNAIALFKPENEGVSEK